MDEVERMEPSKRRGSNWPIQPFQHQGRELLALRKMEHYIASRSRLQRQPISREVEVCQGFTNCSLTVTPLEHRRNFSPVEIRGMLDGKKRWRIRLVGKVTKVPACTCFMVQKSTFALLPGVWKFWFLIKKLPPPFQKRKNYSIKMKYNLKTSFHFATE